MENNSTVESPKKSGGKRLLVTIVILLLIATNGVLIWMLFNKSETITRTQTEVVRVNASKDSLVAEYAELNKQFDALKGENGELNSKLAESDQQIAELKEKIQKMINSGDAAQLAAARAELKNLKARISRYEAQKDSLINLTQVLGKEKQQLTTNLSEEKKKTENLTEVNVKLSDKVTVGSVLRVDNVKIYAIKVKSSGKEVEVNKAKATNKLKTCFTVLENHVAEKGDKDFYIRILGPEGNAYTSSSETFKYNGQETLFTLKQTVSFDKKKQEVCVMWSNPNPYSKGKYTVEVYNESTQVGKAQLELK